MHRALLLSFHTAFSVLEGVTYQSEDQPEGVREVIDLCEGKRDFTLKEHYSLAPAELPKTCAGLFVNVQQQDLSPV